MDETLRKQIDAWAETDEHGRIVDMLGQTSPEERDSEATGLLARAYNNLGEYEKALPFRKRVKDFWKWFTDNEEDLSRIVENRGQLDGGDAVEFVTAGTNLIDEDVHFNLGGDYEFTFSVEGNICSISIPTLCRKCLHNSRINGTFFLSIRGRMQVSLSACMGRM